MNWVQNIFQVGQPPANVMYGEYDLSFVFLSYVVASFASFVALDMSAHLRRPVTF